MQTVVETPIYLRDAQAAGLSDEERKRIVDFVAVNPDAGHEIPGTGGAHKVRFAGKGRGKSGGYRVITFYSGEDMTVFLLNVFAKNKKLTCNRKNETSSRPSWASLPRLIEGGYDHAEEETDRRTAHDRERQRGPGLRQRRNQRRRRPYP
jgi:mRNA-degrading endonuclease RelE of RelBE toxin-antitoxin system